MGLDPLQFQYGYNSYNNGYNFGSLTSGQNRYAQGVPNTTPQVQPSFKMPSADDMDKVLKAQEEGYISEVNPFDAYSNKELQNMKDIYSGSGELVADISGGDDRIEESDFYKKYPQGLAA